MKQLQLSPSTYEGVKVVEWYRWWNVLEEMPNGWVVDKYAGSPYPRAVFITNNTSPLNPNHKRAILKVGAVTDYPPPEPDPVVAKNATAPEVKEDIPFPAKKVNDLARAKFKEQLLNDIRIDLAICDIEGWDKGEYIRELQSLIGSFKV